MNNNNLTAELLPIKDLFNNTNYLVPIYQRNYSWRHTQIEQLINDIQDAIIQNENSYFIGNLVVTRNKSDENSSSTQFVVIDGQQRLTTINLLLTFLEKDGTTHYNEHKGRLQYESRIRATDALRRIGQKSAMPIDQSQESLTSENTGIHEGFKIIEQVIQQHKNLTRCQFANFLLDQVTVARSSLPPGTDLNRYFEIMNTRGQQLRQVDIVKARLMSKLPTGEHGTFAWIWDACAEMDVYVQMTLTRGNTNQRDRIFGENWSWLQAKNFQSLHDERQTPSISSPSGNTNLTLDQALKKYAHSQVVSIKEDEGSERFRSTIDFPVFLLHVLKVTKGEQTKDEGQLDDKHLIQSFKKAIKLNEDQAEHWVRDFIFTLLKCRNLFDSFIVKRQFSSQNLDEDGEWSLRRLEKKESCKSGYVHVFYKKKEELEEEGEADTGTRDVLLLQSMLRITYTSPRSMHWMTDILQYLVDTQNPGEVSSCQISDRLIKYAREEVAEAYFKPQSRPKGFKIGRIVFTYLDYLLLEEQTQQNFKFQFRNSIEHFYPQHPNQEQQRPSFSDHNLHLLGNLALVSISANSQFSNNIPQIKASYFADIISQSPKLTKMAEIAKKHSWDDAQVEEHHRQMEEKLLKDLQKGGLCQSVCGP